MVGGTNLKIGGWHDQKWNAKCRELEEFKAEHGNCIVPTTEGLLGGWVHTQRTARKKGKLSKQRIQRLDEIGFVWNPRGPPWDERFRELTRYKAEHGHCNVLQSQGSLGIWVSTQRVAYKNRKLVAGRAQKLNDIGFDWGTTRGALTTWDERLRELTKYKAEHGHCNVPAIQGPLGKWVDHQRSARKKGKLSKERIEQFDDLGFNWGTTLPTWDERLGELTNYKSKHSDCNVAQSHGPLGHWVNTQRATRKKGKLSEERVQKLETIGFVWNPLSTQPLPWNSRYRELEAFKANQGHCNVPQGQGSLGEWVKNLRQRKGNLSKKRIQQLDELGFNWGTTRGSSPTWQDRYNELKEYKKEHGDCNVPLNHGPLGLWVSIQRKVRTRLLSKERIQLLNEIGFE